LFDAAPELPASVVLKLPSLDPTSRATGVMLRNYEREVKFYLELASTVEIRVPKCHFGEWTESTGDFVLVLEDMSPAAPGDQLAGCTIADAELAVDEIARLHGPRWADDSLADIDWLSRRTAEDIEMMNGMWAIFLPPFLATYSKHLDAEALALLDAFGPKLGAWIEDRDGPETVTHGDYRLDNLMFGTPAGGPQLTTLDWQTPGHGAPVADLAYFCGAGLLPPERAVHERSLVDRYGLALLAHGVDVKESWLWEQYRRDSFAGVVMAVIASQVVGESERSEALFATMATRHLQHALDLDALELI
jgi:hypothetical protein